MYILVVDVDPNALAIGMAVALGVKPSIWKTSTWTRESTSTLISSQNDNIRSYGILPRSLAPLRN